MKTNHRTFRSSSNNLLLLRRIGSKRADGEEEQPQHEDAKPIGDAIRFSGKGRGRRKHYESFEYDGNQYVVVSFTEDPVLLVPEDKGQKPYVAIIKDIIQSQNGSMMVTGQWFYRPEEAERKGGGNWQSHDSRDLFYSFHRDEVPAESVMHKCVVHFVPIQKQLPNRKQHPGFIVQKVYDFVEKKLWKLTDKEYEETEQQEIDDLVQKTLERLGDLPDIEAEDTLADKEDQMKKKRGLKRKNISPLNVSREEKETPSPKNDQNLKSTTPGSCVNTDSEHYCILSKFKALTGDTRRDKWLEKLLQTVQGICISDDSRLRDDKGDDKSDAVHSGSNKGSLEIANECQDKGQKSSKFFIWPDSAVPAIVALEKASHDALSTDYMKYNQKLRTLYFNLKGGTLLAHRLLNGELEPPKMINLSSIELKKGMTAEEIEKEQQKQLGNFIHYMATFVSGFVVGFTAVWQLALVTLAVVPMIAVIGGIHTTTLAKLSGKSQEALSQAGNTVE
ncbi:ABC transporter F family member 4 [Senna tora]|uniref:ABC transporter F family member 4 n=1 Tax=Senna tora TaxID=362788 RepID=A0A834SUQ6_9FABA|nr:ABC transporter F family member 4 [Senna tora]